MNKKVLLDTNIIIHREGFSVQKPSIVQLFYWLDKLKYDKYVHIKTIDEINRYNDIAKRDVILQKVKAYNIDNCTSDISNEFNDIVIKFDGKENDGVDNILLNEVYCNCFDYLITEDGKIIKKAEALGISHKVLSIDDFIYQCDEEYPNLTEYKFDKVQPKKFSDIDLKDSFFDSLRENYKEFDVWYNRKMVEGESAYVNFDKDKKLRGFLYIKQESNEEIYHDIEPVFKSLKRLKIGTFKVEATGYRLGERFLQIIFDNAIEKNVDEIYVTMYDLEPNVEHLKLLLLDWGFEYYGIKKHEDEKNESIYVKRMKYYNSNKSIAENFPNVDYKTKKYFLPILPKYHTQIFPDAILRTEGNVSFDDYNANRYSLEKCYISFTYKTNFRVGDIVAIYRNGEHPGRKAYESVVSSICVISEVIYNNQINNINKMLSFCKNRSVFSEKELKEFYSNKKDKQLIKMILIKSLNKKVILKELWDNYIVNFPNGARPFDEISNEAFNKILELSNTKLYEV